MARHRLAAVAVACAIASLARPARASCALALDGDAPTVAAIRAALAGFAGDDAGCIALRAEAERDGAEIRLEISDELGRTARRRFLGPAGAAAFLISWSQRPLWFAGLTAPGVTAPVMPAPRPPVPDAAAWSGEFHLAYIRAFDSERYWVTSMAALIRRRGIWRYGGDVRTTVSPLLPSDDFGIDGTIWLGLEAEGTFGAAWAASDRLQLRGEVAAGGAYLGIVRSNKLDQTIPGVRGGVRGTLALRLVRDLWLEFVPAWDAIYQIGDVPLSRPFGNFRLYQQVHFDFGLAWIL